MSAEQNALPEWAWEQAAEVGQTCFDAHVDLYEAGSSPTDPQLVIARALVEAEKRGLERAARYMDWQIGDASRQFAAAIRALGAQP
jgi:hypothetical protein